MDSRTLAKIGLIVLGIGVTATVIGITVKQKKAKAQVPGIVSEPASQQANTTEPKNQGANKPPVQTTTAEPLPTNTANVKIAGFPRYGKITAENGMYARSAPSTDSKPVTTLNKGQQISVTGEVGAFYRTFLVRSDRGMTEVYVGKKYVQLV